MTLTSLFLVCWISWMIPKLTMPTFCKCLIMIVDKSKEIGPLKDVLLCFSDKLIVVLIPRLWHLRYWLTQQHCPGLQPGWPQHKCHSQVHQENHRQECNCAANGVNRVESEPEHNFWSWNMMLGSSSKLQLCIKQLDIVQLFKGCKSSLRDSCTAEIRKENLFFPVWIIADVTRLTTTLIFCICGTWSEH